MTERLPATNAVAECELLWLHHALWCSANVNATDRWGGTPLRDAVREGRTEVAEALRAAGGDLGYNEVEASGELCELSKAGSLEKLTILLGCGVAINAQDYDKRVRTHWEGCLEWPCIGHLAHTRCVRVAADCVAFGCKRGQLAHCEGAD